MVRWSAAPADHQVRDSERLGRPWAAKPVRWTSLAPEKPLKGSILGLYLRLLTLHLWLRLMPAEFRQVSHEGLFVSGRVPRA